MRTTIKQAALEYLQRHWSVIPVRAHDKRPAIRWQQYLGRLATSTELDEWFLKWPNANIGIVTGAISGLVVLDIDPEHGGNESLAQLLREYGPISHTVEAQTGGGGWVWLRDSTCAAMAVLLWPPLPFTQTAGYIAGSSAMIPDKHRLRHCLVG